MAAIRYKAPQAWRQALCGMPNISNPYEKGSVQRNRNGFFGPPEGPCDCEAIYLFIYKICYYGKDHSH